MEFILHFPKKKKVEEIEMTFLSNMSIAKTIQNRMLFYLVVKCKLIKINWEQTSHLIEYHLPKKMVFFWFAERYESFCFNDEVSHLPSVNFANAEFASFVARDISAQQEISQEEVTSRR